MLSLSGTIMTAISIVITVISLLFEGTIALRVAIVIVISIS